MANFPILLTLPIIIIMLLPTLHAVSTTLKDQVPCTMCAECENPCQPLPPPPSLPPPPPVSECPPPPPPPPPVIIPEFPPPPKPTCSPCETLPPPPAAAEPSCENDGSCLPSPVPPPAPPYPWILPPQSHQYLSPDQPYFPPGPPRPSYLLPWTPFPAENNRAAPARHEFALWNSSLLLYLLHISLLVVLIF